MTCREFKHRAALLTLWMVSQTRDEQILSHTEECEACGSWLQKQRSLAASMQTLQTRTAGLEAGPDVERALLRAFRQATPARVGVEERKEPLRLVAAPRSTPIALRLSRMFEVGAYVAVAAAIVVGVFLGVQLLQHRGEIAPVQSQTAAGSSSPVIQQPLAAAQAEPVKPAANDKHELVTTAAVERAHVARGSRPSPASVLPETTEETQPTTDAGYIALMFCDPLSCATDSQVVRMELPAQNNAQPQMADVVVGFDGVVRAVRIVN